MLYRDCGTNIRGKGANNLVFSSSGPWLGVGGGEPTGGGRCGRQVCQSWDLKPGSLGFESAL